MAFPETHPHIPLTPEDETWAREVEETWADVLPFPESRPYEPSAYKLIEEGSLTDDLLRARLELDGQPVAEIQFCFYNEGRTVEIEEMVAGEGLADISQAVQGIADHFDRIGFVERIDAFPTAEDDPLLAADPNLPPGWLKVEDQFQSLVLTKLAA